MLRCVAVLLLGFTVVPASLNLNWDTLSDVACMAREFKSVSNHWSSFSQHCDELGYKQLWSKHMLAPESLLFQNDNGEIQSHIGGGLHCLVFDSLFDNRRILLFRHQEDDMLEAMSLFGRNYMEQVFGSTLFGVGTAGSNVADWVQKKLFHSRVDSGIDYYHQAYIVASFMTKDVDLTVAGYSMGGVYASLISATLDVPAILLSANGVADVAADLYQIDVSSVNAVNFVPKGDDVPLLDCQVEPTICVCDTQANDNTHEDWIYNSALITSCIKDDAFVCVEALYWNENAFCSHKSSSTGDT